MTVNSTREQVAGMLAAADEEARLEGLRLLAACGADLDQRQLFQALGDVSWRVRKAATDLFLTLPASRQRLGDVIGLLHAEDNAGLRNAAVDILVRMGRDAVPLLLQEAGCPDPGVRKFVVDILGEIGDPGVVPTLLAALADNDDNVRAAAAENLGKLRADQAVPALLDALQHPDVLLRFTILEALGKIAIPVPFARLAALREDKLLRKALIDCLGKVGDIDAADELMASMADPMRNVREAGLLGLAALAERYPEEVRHLLSSKDFAAMTDTLLSALDSGQMSGTRQAAVRILGWLGTPSAVRPLLARLDDEGLQQDILFALVSIGTLHPRLLLDAWTQSAALERAYLAWVCGEAGCTAAVPLLHEALTDTDTRLVQMAAHALGRLGNIAELDALASCLRHADADVRVAAVQALGALGRNSPAELLAALESLLAAADSSWRASAVAVLGRVADQGDIARRLIMAFKDPAAEVRRAALQALSNEASDHVSTIQLALVDEDAEVRRTAAEVLGDSRNLEAVDGLRLALRDEDIWVRAVAVRSLGRLGGVAEIDAIAALLSDSVGLVSISALETLAELLGEQACPRLLTALHHPDEEVVGITLDLLARHASPTWLQANADTVFSHSSAQIRRQFIPLLLRCLGEPARPILERQLMIEQDDSIRQQLQDCLAEPVVR